jgi:hypothetical protein
MQMKKQCEEHERERKDQEAAAQELLDVLKEFCQPSQPPPPSASQGLMTPRLGTTSSTDSSSWADLENRVSAMSARVGVSPQKHGFLEDTRRSPLRRSTTFRRSRLSLGGRRDPVGSFGEVVAQIARDRNARYASRLTMCMHIPQARCSRVHAP